MEQQIVTGIAYSKDEAQITLRRGRGQARRRRGDLRAARRANINVDMIVQNISDDGAPPT